MIQTDPASGYEVSIYWAYSPFFWFLFSTSILLSSIFILSYEFHKTDKKYLVVSISLIFIAFIVLFLLPLLRGYAFNNRGAGGSVLQVGRIKTILQTGYTGDLFYPAIHILTANLKLIGLSIFEAMLFISILFTFLSISFIHLLSKEFTNNSKNKYSLIFLFCAIPLVYQWFHLSFTPAILSFFTVPIFLYLFESGRKKSRSRFLILSFMIGFFIVFAHPVSLVILIIIIFVWFISEKASVKLFKEKPSGYNYVGTAFALAIPFFAWHQHFSPFPSVVRRFYANIFEETTRSPGGARIEAAEGSMAHLPMFDFIVSTLRSYGPIFIFGGLGLFCLFMSGKKYLKKGELSFYELNLSLQFITGGIFGFALLFFIPITVHPRRIARYAVVMSVLIISYYLFCEFKKVKRDDLNKTRKLIVSLVILLILFSLIISIIGVHSNNRHLTYSEEEGTDWYLTHHDHEKETIHHSMSYRMIHYLYGTNLTIERGDGTNVTLERGDVFHRTGERIPQNLGYNENESLKETFGEEVYLITKARDYHWYEIAHPNQLEQIDYYTEEDLEKVEMDPTTDKLYCNGGFTVWYTNDR